MSCKTTRAASDSGVSVGKVRSAVTFGPLQGGGDQPILRAPTDPRPEMNSRWPVGSLCVFCFVGCFSKPRHTALLWCAGPFRRIGDELPNMRGAYRLTKRRRWQCAASRYQVSLTTRTILHNTKTPGASHWLRAMWG